MPDNMSNAPMVRNLTRLDLKKDILASLGEPVIKVNVTDVQMDSCINTTLKQFWKHHRNGSADNYTVFQLTAEQAAQGWVPIPVHVDAVKEVLPKAFNPSEGNFANFEWQMTAAAMASAGAVGTGGYGATVTSAAPYNQISLSDYALAKQNIDYLRRMTGADTRVFIFNRFQRRLYLHFPLKENDLVVVHWNENVDPENSLLPEATGVWDDEWVKAYAQAQVKIVWGNILRKYGGIALPGGTTLDGQTLVDEGTNDTKDLLDFLSNEQPIDFIVG